jgi:DNA polymerase III delta subunit
MSSLHITKTLDTYLKALAAKDSKASVLVCYGEEEYFHRNLRRALQGFCKQAGFDFQWGAFTELAEGLTAHTQATSLFAPRRITCLQQMHQAQNATVQRMLQRLAAEPPLQNPYVLTYGKATLPAELLKTCKKASFWLMECSPLPAASIPTWISQEALHRGMDLPPASVHRLHQGLGNHISQLDDALSQLSLLDKPLTPDVIAQYVRPTKEESLFYLDQLLLTQQIPQAHLFISTLLERGESVVLLNSLFAKHCRTALLCKRGHTQPGKLRLPPFVVQSYTRYVRNKSERCFLETLRLCQQTDMAIKSSKMPHDLLLSRLIESLQLE